MFDGNTSSSQKVQSTTGLIFESRELGSSALSKVLARDIFERLSRGNVAVAMDRPVALLSAVRKQWLRFMGQTRRAQSSTLDRDKKLRINRELVRLQNVVFTADNPANDPIANVHFATVMTKTRPLLKTTDAILAQLNFIRNKKQEYLVCLSLDSAQRLIRRRVVTIGLLDVALVHPREMFAGPLKDRAASVIVAHNHPSGDPSPSKQDIETTQQLIAAGILLGMPMDDHIIVARMNHYSFREHQYI